MCGGVRVWIVGVWSVCLCRFEECEDGKVRSVWVGR